MLAEADTVTLSTLNNESLCVLLTGGTGTNCTAKGLTSGDYCAGPNGAIGQVCKNGDSVWVSGQFVASAVNVTSGDGCPALCNGGSVGGS